jgi:hypothetical protein
LNVKNAVVAVIPDFIILEETRCLLVSHLNGKEILNLLAGKGDEVFVTYEGKETDDEGKQEEWECYSIKADTTRLHRSDLTMAGKHPESKKSGQKNSIRKSPLKDHLRGLVKQIFKDEDKRGLILNENAHLLEKEEDNIEEDQAA